MYDTKKDGFYPISSNSGSPPILYLEIGNQAGLFPSAPAGLTLILRGNKEGQLTPPVLLKSVRDLKGVCYRPVLL